MEVKITVTGMSCPVCEGRVVKALSALAGVEKVTASAKDQCVTVTGSGLDKLGKAKLIEEIESLGFEAAE